MKKIEVIIIDNGVICTEDKSYIIERPAVMFDKETGTLHKWGNIEDIVKIYGTWVKSDFTGVISKDLVVLEFDILTYTTEQIYEEMYKMIHNSGYCKLFYDRMIGVKA